MQLLGALFKKKIHTRFYIFLYFRKWNFLALILKDFLYFLIFWEIETPKKILMFQEIELLNPEPEKKKKNPS